MRLYFWGFLFLFLPDFIFAERILRVVSDSQVPLADVVVFFSEVKNSHDTLICISDAKGEIHLPMLSDCLYLTNHIEYESARGEIKAKDLAPRIQLIPKSYDLDEFIVISQGLKSPPRELPKNPAVISFRPPLRTGVPNLNDLLMRELPGLNFQKVGFGTAVDINGLDARHVLFLVDGERLTGEMGANLDYQRFNIHAVEEVEILKGASSTLYGSQAAGAVINLKTKKTKKAFALDAGLRYAQMNERNFPRPQRDDFFYMFEKNSDKPNLQSWLSLGSKIGNWTFQTDALYKSVDAYCLYQGKKDVKFFPADPSIALMNDSLIPGMLERPPLGIEGSEDFNFSQKIYFDPSERLGFELYGGLFLMNNYDLLPDLQFSQVRDLSGGLKARYKLLKNYGSLVFSLHSDDYNRFKRSETIDTRHKIYRSFITQPRALFVSNYFEKHAFTVGLEALSETLTSDRFSTSVEGILESRASFDVGVFSQDEFRLSKNTQLTAGFRFNHNNRYGLNFAPKLSLEQRITACNLLVVSYAAGYRSPSLKELYFDWDLLEMFRIVGNSDLKPETNHYFSLANEFSGRGISFSTNAYVNIFRNKIEGVWRTYEMQQNLEYRNLKNALLAGLEMTAKVKINRQFSLNGAYSFFYQKKDKRGVHLNSSSPHSGNLHLTYNFVRNIYDLSATVALLYTGKKEFNVQDKLVIAGEAKDAYFFVQLPGYALCNLSLSQRIADKYELIVGLTNVFDYKAETLGAGISMFNVAVTPGRRAFVSFRISL